MTKMSLSLEFVGPGLHILVITVGTLQLAGVIKFVSLQCHIPLTFRIMNITHVFVGKRFQAMLDII